MRDPNEPWFDQNEMDARYGVNDPFREVEGYGLPCIICGDEGHHVAGHDPTEREDDRG